MAADAEQTEPSRATGNAKGRCVRPAFVIAILIVAAGALAFRLPRLDLRPMHGDEANQAYKAGILLEEGAYIYDPHEHHGPTLYYAFLPVAWLTGARTFAEVNETTLRLVPVFFGTALVLLLLLVGDGLGRAAAVWAGVLTALSPALVFYSRYFIQETMLVFFAFAAIAAGWRYARKPSLGWAIAAGAAIGLMHATKETCVLAFAAIAGALVLTPLWARLRDGSPPTAEMVPRVPRPNWPHVAAFLGAACVVSVVLFSSFFTNPSGIVDSIAAYGDYIHEAGGEGSTANHDKPWPYYLLMLAFSRGSPSQWWSEGLILALAAIGGATALFRRSRRAESPGLARFLTFYAVLLTAFYSAVPYKTPWCAIDFLHPLAILAGIGAAAVIRAGRAAPVRAVLAVLLALGSAHLGVQAFRASYVRFADHRNPYVYAHPVPAVTRLVRRANELAAVHPDGKRMVIKVMATRGDYWPIPWYLRAFERVGYWDHVPADPDAAMVVSSKDLGPRLEATLKKSYQREFVGLRPGHLLQIRIDRDLWDAFMATRMDCVAEE